MIPTTAFNWAVSSMFIGLCVLIRFTTHVHCIVCPLLTAFIYYYLCMIRFKDNEDVDLVYYSLIVGLTLQFYVLIMFSENWLISTGLFTPCVVLFMLKTQ